MLSVERFHLNGSLRQQVKELYRVGMSPECRLLRSDI